eukprot:31322-Pelagococcus_subviridis.AAC.1
MICNENERRYGEARGSLPRALPARQRVSHASKPRVIRVVERLPRARAQPRCIRGVREEEPHADAFLSLLGVDEPERVRAPPLAVVVGREGVGGALIRRARRARQERRVGVVVREDRGALCARLALLIFLLLRVVAVAAFFLVLFLVLVVVVELLVFERVKLAQEKHVVVAKFSRRLLPQREPHDVEPVHALALLHRADHRRPLILVVVRPPQLRRALLQHERLEHVYVLVDGGEGLRHLTERSVPRGLHRVLLLGRAYAVVVPRQDLLLEPREVRRLLLGRERHRARDGAAPRAIGWMWICGHDPGGRRRRRGRDASGATHAATRSKLARRRRRGRVRRARRPDRALVAVGRTAAMARSSSRGKSDFGVSSRGLGFGAATGRKRRVRGGAAARRTYYNTSIKPTTTRSIRPSSPRRLRAPVVILRVPPVRRHRRRRRRRGLEASPGGEVVSVSVLVAVAFSRPPSTTAAAAV